MALLFFLPYLLSDDYLAPSDPTMLARAANDWTNRNWAERRACIRKLVRNFIRPGDTLFDLSALLNQPTWLKDDDVTDWNHACGSFFIPVDIRPEDSTFGIRLLPEPGKNSGAIFLRISGKVDRLEFLRIVRGIRQGDNPRIREIWVDRENE